MTELKYFHAEWCGPCDQQKGIVNEVENEEDITVDRIDIEEDGDIANEYNVRSLPTIVIEDDGQVEKQFTGLTNKSEITASI
jgi:thioredoxin 1